ncbi:hypothetical protein [Bradyrhizobium cenepequi]
MPENIDTGLADLIREVKETRETLHRQDTERQALIDELKKDLATHSKSSSDTQAKLQQVYDDLREIVGNLPTIERLAKLVVATVDRCETLEERLAKLEGGTRDGE